ncbi:hypothetical protein AAG906_017102 [Vitis piasezkii]
MVVAEDGTRLKKIMEQERVFEFLAGLNPELDQRRKTVTRSGQVHQAATIDLKHFSTSLTHAEIPTAKPTHALYQITRKMIGHVMRKGGLYYLNTHWKIGDSIPKILLPPTILKS